MGNDVYEQKAIFHITTIVWLNEREELYVRLIASLEFPHLITEHEHKIILEWKTAQRQHNDCNIIIIQMGGTGWW